MELTLDQYARIEPFLPIQRGNVTLENWQVINAILLVAHCRRAMATGTRLTRR